MATLKFLKLKSILTSADLGLEKDFLVGVRLEKGDPGEKVCNKNGCQSEKGKVRYSKSFTWVA